MLVLTTTSTDTIKVVLGGAHTTNALSVYATWRDITTTGYTPGRTAIATNGATPVIAVGAPGASTQRVIDYLSVYNHDTVSQTVTVSYYDDATQYRLMRVVLGTTEKLEYAEGAGWRVLTADAASQKLSINQGTAAAGTGRQIAVLGSDRTNNNASANTIADVTGLSFAVTSGLLYRFRFVIPYTAAVNTTGSRWAVNGPGSPTLLYYTSHYTLTATTETVNYATAYDIPAASNASSLTGAGNLAIIEGFIKPSANGTVIARFASEVSSSAIVAKAGAFVEYEVVA